MTTSEMEKGFQEIWKLFAETDKRFKETDQQIRATDRQLKETDKKIENLIGRWSLFVEGLVIPATERMFRERGITVRSVHPHVKVHRNGREGMEIDILAVNQEYVILIEVKSTLGVRDVNEHIERMKKFRTYFPEYANKKIVGAVAGIVIQENVDKHAYKKGLFVIAQSGDSVKILNDGEFKPTEW
ncbi:MAG: DUF3782 domain-containing protein [Candidatus Omnitrophota bacterium]|jgi:hypothetical protein|nr:MAG: DUF3782 domain-containing protein [Candidatus Omnitrophota bacterium]